MLHREEDAIVLDSEAAGETDRRVLLLTAQGALLRALAPSAARSRRRFGGALQPAARVHARWTVRTDDALAILEEAALLQAPPAPDPLERYYVVAHVLETAAAFAREGQDDPHLYRLVVAVLDRLGAGDAPDPLARYAEAWILRLAGLLPDLDACGACGASLAGAPARVDAERGAFCGACAPAGARALGAAAVQWVESTRGVAPKDLVEPAAGAAAELARALPALITDVTERPLKAWPALVRLRRAAESA